MMRAARRASLLVAFCLLVAAFLAGCTSTKTDVKARAASVRFAQDRDEVRGCDLLGVARDDDMDDLRKKVAKLGGNTALFVDREWAWPTRTVTVAQVYKCGPR